MAMLRAETLNIVVVMSGTPLNSTKWDLSCAYRDRGVSDIGSHYIVLEDGDVIKGRPHDQHGNVHPQFNKDSVFIEVMGEEGFAINPQQRVAITGVLSRMADIYDAEELDLTHV
jgi:hypothetical protein